MSVKSANEISSNEMSDGNGFSEKSDAKDENITSVVSITKEDLERSNVITTIVSPTGKEVKITGDVDVAMQYALETDSVELDEAKDRRLLRKIDLFMLPVMCLLYAFQFMDKLSNSYASIMGLREDLHMEGNMYSWSGTAFYLGYLVFEFPACFILQRFPVAKTVSVFIVLWGLILCLHAVPQYAGFIALRTILGMLESSVTPAFVIITGQFYKKEEQFLRTTIWFACNGLGTIIGSGIIGYNLAVNDGSYPIAAWKLVFVITGCLTIGLGFVVFFHVPDSPMNAWFLNQEEKQLVVERIRKNQQGFGNTHFKKYQFIEAFKDPQTYLLFIFAAANNIPNGGLTNFGSILLVGDLGYSPLKSLLMGMPQGAVELVGCILFAYGTRFIKSRMFWAISGTVVTVMAECLLAFGEGANTQFAGYCIYTLGPIGFICILSCVSSNVAGHTKKVTVNAIYLVGYCVGNLVGPQTFLANEAPGYSTAKICIVVFGVVSLIDMCVICLYYIYANRKRDAKREKMDIPVVENMEFADLTDMENPNFRYDW